MTAPRLFEPRLLRLRKQRRAKHLAEAAFLHARAGVDLAERLEAIPRRFEKTLVLGGQGAFRRALAGHASLRERLGWMVEADIAAAAVEIDLERGPFADGTFDLVVSPLLLHWANDLPGALSQVRRALKPDGLALAALLGGETLTELRLALLEAEAEKCGGAAMRISPFATVQDVGRLMQRAGFALPAADRDVVTVRYADPLKLLFDLRAMGETAAFAEPAAHALSRGVLSRAMEIYRARHADNDGRVRATFEIITATGWAPHESQQKPLRPGSAKTRLADALGVREHNPSSDEDP